MKVRQDGAVFLTWNDSRRSVSLAAQLGIPRIVLVAELHGARRHLQGAIETISCLVRHRPALVWYQFSLGLATVVALYRFLAGGKRVHLVADLHTKALRRSSPMGLRRLLRSLKRLLLRACTCTLVTNAENAAYAEATFGITPQILPDPLPNVPVKAARGPRVQERDVVFICSFAADEPIELIREVAMRLASDFKVAVTGDPRRLPGGSAGNLRDNVIFTGWLSEAEYWRCLRAARAVVVLSTQNACLPCGAYEAISVGIRPVLADDEEVRSFFGEAAIYAPLETAALEQVVRSVLAKPKDRTGEVAAIFRRRWNHYWHSVRLHLESNALIRCSAAGGSH